MALTSGGGAAVGLVAIYFLVMATKPVQASPGYVVCYYSSWAHYRQGLAKYTVEDIPVDLCTHLIYAFATLDSKTHLAKPFDPWLDIDLKNYEKFVQLKKKNPKMKVLLGVGGWNDSRSTKYSIMVADPNKRKRFAEEVVKLLLEYDFDGLDLDWEYPGYESKSEDKEGFTRWVEDLKAALTPHGLLLTSAVSASRRVIDKGYDVPRIAKHLDFINLMSYDFHGSWERVVAHHSPLYPEPGQNPEFNSDFAVNHWIKKGFPANKIVLGVPLYGRSWTLAGTGNSPGAPARGAGKPGKYVKERGHMAYYECCLAHQKDGWVKVTGVGGPYLTKDDQWVGYDDIESVTVKAKYALEKGLGGIMVWDTVSDDFNNACGHGTNPLLTAIFNTLHGIQNPTTQFSESTTPPGDSATTVSSRPEVWSRANDWKQPGGGSGASSGSGNTIGGSSGVKNSPSGTGSSSSTKLPYDWLAWPIFSKRPQSSQNSISTGVSAPPPSFSTSSIQLSSTTQRSTNPKGTIDKISPGQVTKSPYPWLSWPIFNKGSQGHQNSISSSGSGSFTSATPSTLSSTILQNSVTTTTLFQDNGDAITGSDVTGVDSSQTTTSRYAWVSWPIFNPSQGDQNLVTVSTPSGTSAFVTTTQSPSISSDFSTIVTAPVASQTTGIQSKGSNGLDKGSSKSTVPPYKWLSWPVFNRESGITDNSISNSNTQTVSSFASSTPPPLTSSPNIPPSIKSKFSSSSSALSWFSDCRSAGFASDPGSCSAFYRCTEKFAYRFDCPAGLLWHQDESSCDWPDSVQCILPLSRPDVEQFQPPDPVAI